MVTAVILRGPATLSGEGAELWDTDVLRFSWCMNAAIVSSVRGRLAETHLAGRDRETTSRLKI